MGQMIKDITAKASGTTNIAVDLATTNGEYPYRMYRFTGSAVLGAQWTISASGTAETDDEFTFIWDATVTADTSTGKKVTIFGTDMPDSLVANNCIIKAIYDGSAWQLYAFVSLHETRTISTTMLELLAVTDAEINDVAASKITGTVSNAQIASGVDAAKLTTGTLPAARIAAGSLDNTVLSSITKIYTKYSATGTTAVTTEETLASTTLSAGLLSADGMGIKVEVFGTTASNVNTKTIRVKVDGNTIVSNGTTTAPNGLNWEAEMTILRSGATSSTSKGMIAFDGVADEVDTSKPGITWANAIDVAVTGQNGTASANDIVVELVVVTLIS